MRPIVTLVAAACLSVHTLLGCCWHHVWSDQACAAVAEAVDSHAHAHCHSRCCDGTSHQHPPGEPCPCNTECKGTCNFLPTVKVQCQAPNATGFVAILSATTDNLGLPSLVASHELASTRPQAALSMRLHLLHQVLQV